MSQGVVDGEWIVTRKINIYMKGWEFQWRDEWMGNGVERKCVNG